MVRAGDSVEDRSWYLSTREITSALRQSEPNAYVISTLTVNHAMLDVALLVSASNWSTSLCRSTRFRNCGSLLRFITVSVDRRAECGRTLNLDQMTLTAIRRERVFAQQFEQNPLRNGLIPLCLVQVKLQYL